MDFVLENTDLSELHHPAAVKTVVTSELGAEIARKKGLMVFSTLTGFKFIGEKITQFEQAKIKGIPEQDYDFVLGYEDWISTLRGFAILLVFMSHLESEGGATFKFVIGRIGVVIFFLFSGYLAVNAREKRSGSQYLFNRLIRMYPVYWVILVLAFLSRNLLRTGDSISIVTLLANMTLFHQFIGIDEILDTS